MIPRSFFGVLVDTCGGCGGIYFDEGEVSKIRAQGGPKAFEELDNMIQPEPGHVPSADDGQRRCPGCKATMTRFRYMYASPVFLDSCDACGGVWIENGELIQMKEYLEAAKAGKEPKPTTVPIGTILHDRQEKARRAHVAAQAMAYLPWQ